MRPGWRLASIGVLVAALFSMLVLRMWFLQVSEIEDSLEVAESQQVLTVTVDAPRGDVFDRDGTELMAGTIANLRVVVDRRLVPEEREDELIENLSTLLGISAEEIRDTFEENGEGRRFPVGGEIGQSTGIFALENIESFPGISIEPVPVRVYPLGETAAHIVGYVGAPGAIDLERPDISARDQVGKFGVERSYDRLLRGTPGRITYRINGQGQILGVIDETPPQPGGSVVTTIDLDTQRFVEESLAAAIRLARQEGETDVKRAAAVVMDPRDGSIIAMASVPSFDPTLFADGQISQEEWDRLSEDAVLNNFAIQGLYPPGSSFKVPVYALALEEDIYPTVDDDEDDDDGGINPFPDDPTAWYSDGQLLFPETPPLNDWREGGHGWVTLSTSLHESVNTYYWSIALQIWNNRGVEWEEDLLQEWARTLGFGDRTGIDLPFEQQGLVPDREWFQFHQRGNTGLVRTEGVWAGGDVMNIATGQGALVVTPIQMATAYAALVNGGTVWQPRVVDSVRDAENNELFSNLPSAARVVDLKATTVLRLKNDLRGVVSAVNGTARRAFEEFCDGEGPGEEAGGCPALDEVGGKTGTAEIARATNEDEQDIDTAWFVGVAPLSDPEWVVAVVVDQGGSGGQVAAPTARRIFQLLMGESPDPIRSGDDTER